MSQDESSLFLVNWGAFGTLQVRLLTRYRQPLLLLLMP
jgi:hypothetical protein